jgi:hypothetical protein
MIKKGILFLKIKVKNMAFSASSASQIDSGVAGQSVSLCPSSSNPDRIRSYREIFWENKRDQQEEYALLKGYFSEKISRIIIDLTPSELDEATQEGDVSTFMELLEGSKFSITAKTLLCACQGRNRFLIQCSLENKASVTTESIECAIQQRDDLALKVLEVHGAVFTEKTLEIAAQHFSVKIVEYLVGKKITITQEVFENAVKNPNYNIASFFMEIGVIPTAQNLESAALMGNLYTVKEIVKRAPETITVKALVCAIRSGNASFEKVKFLVRKKVPITAETFQVALHSGNSRIVKYLKKQNPPITAKA